METIENSLFNGDIGITVYSPDVFHSGISTEIDKFISDNTGLIPIIRHQFNHDAASIERFYATGIHKNVPNWHYVVKLFVSGPSLLTFWYGREAIDKLNRVKGKSHPALAKSDTVRGYFNCDNAICNLIHTTDDINELMRELIAIEQYGILKTLLKKETVDSSFFKGNERKLWYNGAFIFLNFLCDILKRNNAIVVDKYNSSSEFYNACIKEIMKIKEIVEPKVSKLINAFLIGDEMIQYELEKCGVDEDERFIIACSAATRSGWGQQINIYDAVHEVLKKLKGIYGFFIGGSTAAKLYGYKCLVGDIDVICTDEALKEISSLLELKIETIEKSFGKYQCCKYECCGYEVEFSTMAEYKKGYNFKIDEEMLSRANGWIPLMPKEDLICELCTLERMDYHEDLKRAKSYCRYFGKNLDKDYLKNRFIESGIGIKKYNEIIS